MPHSKQSPRIAYVIPQRVAEHNLEVLYSANAWWMEQSKVHKLLAGFAMDMTIMEACIYTGITERQYKYFDQLHPIIREIRYDLRGLLQFRARVSVAKAIENGDGRMARWYLERSLPEEFGKPSIKARREAFKEVVSTRKGVEDDRKEYSNPNDALQKVSKIKSASKPEHHLSIKERLKKLGG